MYGGYKSQTSYDSLEVNAVKNALIAWYQEATIHSCCAKRWRQCG